MKLKLRLSSWYTLGVGNVSIPNVADVAASPTTETRCFNRGDTRERGKCRGRCHIPQKSRFNHQCRMTIQPQLRNIIMRQQLTCIKYLEQNTEPCSFIIVASLTICQILQHHYARFFSSFRSQENTKMLRGLSRR